MLAHELLRPSKQKYFVSLKQPLPTLQCQTAAVFTLIPSFTVSGENTTYSHKELLLLA